MFFLKRPPIPKVELKDVMTGKFRDFDIAKLDIKFNLKRLLKALEKAELKSGFYSKDSSTSYKAIGLQYSLDENADTDAIDTLWTVRQGKTFLVRKTFNFFTRINQYGQCFDFVFEKFSGQIGLSRGRILRMFPQSYIHPHNDGPSELRIHIPIRSHPECLSLFGNQGYYLKPDGSAYLFNASRDHGYVNFSDKSRDHIVFSVYLNYTHYQARARLDHEISDSHKKALTEYHYSMTVEPGAHCVCCECPRGLTLVLLDRVVPWDQAICRDNLVLMCKPCQHKFYQDIGYDHYSREKSLSYLHEFSSLYN